MTDVKAKDHTRLSSEMIARMEADPEYKRKIVMEHQEFWRQRLAEMDECSKWLSGNISPNTSTLKTFEKMGRKILKMNRKRNAIMRRKEKSMKCGK